MLNNNSFLDISSVRKHIRSIQTLWSHPIVYALFLYISSRIIVHYLGVHYKININVYWQFLAKEWLRAEPLWNPLFYLHSQPPLMNLLIGLSLQLPLSIEIVWDLAYHILGVGLLLTLYSFFREFSLNSTWSAFLAFTFLILPPSILYEHLFYMTYIISFLITFLSLCLVKIAREANPFKIWLAAGTVFLLVMLKPLFHPAWALLIGIGIITSARMKSETILTVIRSFGLVLFLIGLVCLKNLVFFGFFGTTSWTGLNMAAMTHHTSLMDDHCKRKLHRMLKKGQLSPASLHALKTPLVFHAAGDYIIAQKDYKSIHSSIGQRFKLNQRLTNFNHLSIIPFSKELKKDSLRILWECPTVPLKRHLISVHQFFFVLSSEYGQLKYNREALGQWNNLYRILLLDDLASPGTLLELFSVDVINQVPADTSGIIDFIKERIRDARFAYLHGILLVAISFFYTYRIWDDLINYHEAGNDHRWLILVPIILYVAFVPTIINGKEIPRFRFLLEPLFYVFLVVLLRKMIATIENPLEMLC